MKGAVEYIDIEEASWLGNLLTPWSRVLLEKLTVCS
jgi:hypothetical protein